MTTDAQAALANMRKAIQGVIDPAVLLMTTNEANAILAHVEAQKAEIERLTAERDDLRRQLAEAEQDARRYRWLRGREDGRYMTVYAFRTDVDEVCLGEELDATIDAAMGVR